MKTASTCNTVLRYVCTVCLFTLYLLQFPRNPWLFYKMLKIILSLTFLQWIPNCTNTSQKWASYRLNKYPYYFVDVNIHLIELILSLKCSVSHLNGDWTVSARWVHSEQTLHEHMLNENWGGLNYEQWANAEHKQSANMSANWTVNARWMLCECRMNDLFGVPLELFLVHCFFFSNEENNNKLTTYMYCYQPK